MAVSRGGHKLIFVGFLFFAVGLVLLAFGNSERAEKLIKQIDSEIANCYALLEELEEDTSPDAIAQTNELDNKCTYLYKQRKIQSKSRGKIKYMFIFGAIIFALLGFLILFS